MTHRMVAGHRQPADQRARSLHRPADRGRAGPPAASRRFDAEVVFEACRSFDVAVEINSRPERRDPPTELLRLAMEMGCLFSIDTDAHAPGTAGVPDLRLRAGRVTRARSGPGDQHLAGRPAADWCAKG